MAGWSSTSAMHPLPRRRLAHEDSGQGPADLLGGAGVAEDGCPQSAPAALGTGPAGRLGRAPRALGRAGGSAQAQGSVADRAQGRRTAVVAGEPGGVADARRLHQDRPVLHRLAQQLERLARQPRRAGGGVAGEVALGVAGEADGDALADEVAGRGHLGGPAGAQEVLRLDAAGVRRQHGRAAGLLGAHQQDLAGMGVRRPRLVVQVVAVVPDRHQAEVADGRERGRAGADHDPDRSARDGQERAVALRRARVGLEHDVSALAEPRRQRSVEPVEVAVVGDAHQGPAAGERGGDHGLGQDRGPVVAGHHGPDGPRRAVGQPVEDVDAARVVLDEIGVDARLDRRAPARSAASRRWRAAAGRPAAARRSGCRRTSRPRRRSARPRRG